MKKHDENDETYDLGGFLLQALRIIKLEKDLSVTVQLYMAHQHWAYTKDKEKERAK